MGERTFEVGTVYSKGGQNYLCLQSAAAPAPVLVSLRGRLSTLQAFALTTRVQDIDSFTRVRNFQVLELRESWGVSLEDFDRGVATVLEQYRFRAAAKRRRKPVKTSIFGIVLQVKTSSTRPFT